MQRCVWWILVIGITAVLLWFLPQGDAQQAAAFLLWWVLPALAWARLGDNNTPRRGQSKDSADSSVFVRVRPRPIFQEERPLTAVGLTFLLAVIAVLLFHYLPGPMSRWAVLALGVLLALLPLFIRMWTNADESGEGNGSADDANRGGFLRISMKKIRENPFKPALSALPLLLISTVLLRLVNLGYKEFQGDEGIILMRAAAALLGDDAELWLHQKGPVEILLPLLTWGSSGTITEFWARLPFLLANVAAIMAVMALAHRWFGRRVALIAELLLAINGFTIAFGRIIQYQSLVMLWGSLALLHADRYRQDGKQRDLLLVAAFLAGGLLAHYDAVLVVPAIVWLLWPRLWPLHQLDWAVWGKGVLVGAVCLGLFYVPFLLNPNFARTGSYLLQGRLQGGDEGSWLNWSGPAVWQMITFYNSLYYTVGLLLLLLVGAWFWQRGWEKTAVLLAFLVPLLFYTLVVIDPRTHIYTFFPAASILAALGADYLWQFVRVRPRLSASYLQTAVFALFIAISTLYVILMFVDVTPERQRTWAENRPPFYPTTWDEPPLYGVFGFPHQAGWRAVAALPLPWPYGSNEEEEVTQFYLADAPHTYCQNAETFILAQQVQDEMPYDAAFVAGLHQQYEVTVNGRSSLKIYTRQPADQVETIEATTFRQWRTPEEMVGRGEGEAETAVSHPASLILGDQQVQFLGYDIDQTNAHPSGTLTVVLYWQALTPFTQNYQTFAHLLQDGTLYAQHDGAPECNITPTTHWEPGQIIADPHIIPIPAATPLGSYTLVTGMYNLITQERLPVPNMEHNLITLDSVALTEKPNTVESTDIAKP